MSGFVRRPHFTVRMRTDLADELRQAAIDLDCSQGVLLEVLWRKAKAVNLVTGADVFAYDSEARWVEERTQA